MIHFSDMSDIFATIPLCVCRVYVVFCTACLVNKLAAETVKRSIGILKLDVVELWSSMAASFWQTTKAKSGEVLFYFNSATGEKIWSNNLHINTKNNHQTIPGKTDREPRFGSQSNERVQRNVVIKQEESPDQTDGQVDTGFILNQIAHNDAIRDHALKESSSKTLNKQVCNSECESFLAETTALDAPDANYDSKNSNKLTQDKDEPHPESLKTEDGINCKGKSVFSLTEFLPDALDTFNEAKPVQVAEGDSKHSRRKAKTYFPCQFCTKCLSSYKYLQNHVKVHQKNFERMAMQRSRGNCRSNVHYSGKRVAKRQACSLVLRSNDALVANTNSDDADGAPQNIDIELLEHIQSGGQKRGVAVESFNVLSGNDSLENANAKESLHKTDLPNSDEVNNNYVKIKGTFPCHLCKKVLRSHAFLQRHLKHHKVPQIQHRRKVKNVKKESIPTEMAKGENMLNKMKIPGQRETGRKDPEVTKSYNADHSVTAPVPQLQNSKVAAGNTNSERNQDTVNTVDCTDKECFGSLVEGCHDDISSRDAAGTHGDTRNSVKQEYSVDTMTSTSSGTISMLGYTVNDASPVTTHINVGKVEAKFSKERPFFCDMCPKSFIRNSDLQTHRRRHLGEKPYQCKHPGCSKAFTESGDLTKHVMRHIGFRPHRCEECNKAFYTSGNLKKHQLTHNGVKSFKCEYCERLFLRASSLEMHVRTHTGYKPHKCSECGRTFQRSGLLAIHKRRAHTFERPYKCSNCDRAFYDGTDLRKHMRCHTKEKPYACTHCSKAFSQSSTLNKHLELHRVGEWFPCKECGKRFQNLRYLRKHEFLHTNQKPYKCHVCDKTFAQPGNLKIHIRLHTGERPFECPKCHSRFSQSPHLKKHLSLESCEDAAHRCPICHSRFMRSSALKSHLRSHERNDAVLGAKVDTLPSHVLEGAFSEEIPDKEECKVPVNDF